MKLYVEVWLNFLTLNASRQNRRVVLYVLYYIYPVKVFRHLNSLLYLWPVLVAQLDVHPAGDRRLRIRTPPGRQHSFMEIDH